jgi:hypothetical protein
MRMMFAKHPAMAKEWAGKMTRSAIRGLPEHVGGRKKKKAPRWRGKKARR